MTTTLQARDVTRPATWGRSLLFTSLKSEMLMSLAVLGTAALSLAAMNVLVLQNLLFSEFGALYLILLIVADVIIFVAFGAYKIQGLVLDPLDTIVDTTEAIADGDLSRRVPPGATTEFARLADSINRMTNRLLEEQAQRAHLEKVASVGRLAAGVAHEIGNPLGAMTGYLHLLRTTVNGNADAAEALTGIERESARIDRIMRSMLDYARPRRRVVEPVELNAVVRRVLAMLRDQGTMRQVESALMLEPGLPALTGDPHEIEQMLVNLLLNAVDAMQGNGMVTVVTQCLPFAEVATDADRRSNDPGDFVVPRGHSARVHAWLNTVGNVSRVVELVVADTGPGIPWSDSERVFDPFFTTKDPGKGTGLGLAVVARIVEGFGGTVWVRQAREGGAAFVLCFPVPESMPTASGTGIPAAHGP